MTGSISYSGPKTSSGSSLAAAVSSRSRPLPRRFSLHWLPALIVVANTAYADLFTYQGLVGTSHHATAATGLYGSIIFVLALVPANLLRIRQLSGVRPLWASIRFLAGLRKPLGISAASGSPRTRQWGSRSTSTCRPGS